MPTTYNGIGTHYYGRRNVLKRPGPCSQCGSRNDLTSYDTRLWFVVLFIPVVPLGRKRIVDFCPACTRHVAVDADKWETAKQLEVSGAQDEYRANPTPEAALAAHQQLLNYQQLEAAADFRKSIAETFVANAKVQAGLGSALEQVGQYAEAESCFARALALRADLPEARVGVAEGHIRAGRPDEARRLLDFLAKPGAAQLYSLEPLERLALGYQQAGRHRDALDVFAKLQEALPKIIEHKGFRALVAKSEKAIGKRDSQLPKLPFSWRRLLGTGAGAGGEGSGWRAVLILSVILALVALGFVIANEYVRRHRTLYIVNGYDQPATVTVAGQTATAAPQTPQRLVLCEGRYHATLAGPLQQEVDFEIRQPYFRRWFSHPAWVLNPGGAAILIRNTAVYRRDPPPPTLSFHVGKTLESFDCVTHPFQPLPQSLSMKPHESRTLVQLQVHRGDAVDIVAHLVEKDRLDEALDVAEGWLQAHPDDEQVLRTCAAVARRGKRGERLDAFLRSGLVARPVRIEWHRLYQGLHDNPAGHAALVAEYDTLLRAEPQSSALLYLRGRVDGDRAACRTLFARAAQADPSNPYPCYALGYDRIVAGDWAAARPHLERACELRPTDVGFQHWRRIARLAQDEAPALEQEARTTLAADPADPAAALQLVNALAAQDRRDDALAAATAFGAAFTGKHGKAGAGAAAAVQRQALYAVGGFAALEAATAGDASQDGRATRCAALIELGRPTEAAALLPTGADGSRPAAALALALAARLAGDAATADTWLEKARQALAADNDDSVRAAALLGRGTPPTLAEAQDLALEPSLKALLLATVARQHPQARADLNALARRLNIDRSFPYHLVQRATAAAP